MSDAAPIDPPVGSGDTPDLLRVGEGKFEKLCCALLDAQPDVIGCDKYGQRGQSQFGVDLIAVLKSGGIAVAECKCRKDVDEGLVIEVSNNFFRDYDERWSRRDVRRYLVLVARDASRREVRDQIDVERRRFLERGIEYDLWDSDRLTNRLRPHRGIVTDYLGDAWADRLCGKPFPDSSSSTASVGLSGAVAVSSGSSDAHVELDAIQERANEGLYDDALRDLEALRADETRWPALLARDQARTLRLEAVIRHVRGADLAWVVALLDSADALCAPKSRAARVRVVEAQQGPEAALAYLADPSGADECTAAARLNLLLDRPQAALDALAALESDAEVHRWRALAQLALGALAEARAEVGRALLLKPHALSVCAAAGIVEYFSALAPAALPRRLVLWPQPVPWELVRRDSDALTRLAAAEERFLTILPRLAATGTTASDAAPFEVWRLACLANLPARAQEAEEHCRTLLASSRRNHMALVWAIARNWNVDYRASARALAQALKAGKCDGEQLLALTALRLRAKRYDDALALLDEHRELLPGQRGAELWRLWRVQVLAHAGRVDEAAAVIDGRGEPRAEDAFWLARWASAEKAGEFASYLREADEWWRAQGDAEPLTRGCFLIASRRRVKRQHWNLLAPHRDFLETAVGTARAVELAARVSWETQDYGRCLLTLNERRAAFTDGRLPARLRQLRLACCQNLGLVADALAEAEALAREEPIHDNIMNLVRVHLARGDVQAAAVAARPLRESPTLSPQEALYLASALAPADPRLAQAVFRQGAQRGFTDEQAPAAWILGSQLGLHARELQALHGQMVRLAASGKSPVIRTVSTDEILAHLTQARQHAVQLERDYHAAAVPMHTIAQVQGFALALPYHVWLSERERSPLPQGGLLARWGARPAVEGFPKDAKDVPLLVDLSALLLAEHLEILDDVERVFGPLHLPHSLTSALQEMERKLGPAQPRRIEALEEIERLVASTALGLHGADVAPRWDGISDALWEDMGGHWAAAVSAAHAEGGVMVDFMPVQRLDLKAPPRDLTPDVQAHVVGAGDVARALRELNVLAEQRYADALPVVGGPTTASPPAALRRGGRVLLGCGLGCVLAEARLLDDACRTFVVTLDERERQQALDEARQARVAAELADWVRALRQRVAAGLTHRYMPRAAVEDERIKLSTPPGVSERTLLEALAPSDEPASVLWVDDRCISARALKQGRPTVGVFEVLRALRHYGAIDERTYFEKLLRLRRARVYFAPAEADELVYWLRRAVSNDRFAETEELAVIRRYFASAFEAEVFIVSDRDGDDFGEAPFVISVLHAVCAALGVLWAGPQPAAAKEAMSEWLWESLSIHEVGRLPFGAREPRSDRLAITLASLAMSDPPQGDVPPAEDAAAYTDWLERRVLTDRFDVDPGFRTEVGRQIGRYLSMPAPEGDENDELREARRRYVMGLWADRLPKSLREEIQNDAELLARLGRGLRQVVKIGPFTFPRASVFDDLARAVDTGQAETANTAGDVVTVEATRQAAGAWLLTLRVGDRDPLHWPDALHGLLSGDVREREAALRRYRLAFDCSNARFEHVVAEIATLPRPAARVEAAQAWITSSVVARYDTLAEMLQPGASLERSDLDPPPIERLLGCWRLPLESLDAFMPAHFDDAARTLIADSGLDAALTRLSALPVALPNAVVAALAQLAPDARQALLGEHDRRCHAFLARIHCLWLRLRFPEDDGRAAARRQLDWLAREGLAACRTFLSLAGLAAEQVARQAGSAERGPAARLAAAWLHAHELERLFRARDAPADWLRNLGSWAARGVPTEWLAPSLALLHDAAWPPSLTPEALLLGGLSYAASADAEGAGPLFEELRESWLDPLTWKVDEQARAARIEPAHASRASSDRLGSFLLWRPEVDAVLGAEVSQQLTPEFFDSALERIAQHLENQPNDLRLWWLLVARLTTLPPPEGLAARLAALVLRVEPRHLIVDREDVRAALEVVMFVCAQHGLGQVRVHEDAVRALLVDTARRLPALAVPADEHAQVLWEGCRWAALAAGEPEACARVLAKLLRAVVDAWPALAAGCRDYVQTLADRLPVAQARWLWSLLIHLRALP